VSGENLHLTIAERKSATAKNSDNTTGVLPGWYITYTGTPLRPSAASAVVMAGSRRVQSVRNSATFWVFRSPTLPGAQANHQLLLVLTLPRS